MVSVLTREENLTHAYLVKRLNYDPDTGLFTWKSRPLSDFKGFRSWKSWNTKYAGTVAGTETEGRIKIRIKVGDNSPVQYMAHRLAWLYVYGEWPPRGKVIDHIDGNACNNKISNLRAVDYVVNNRNKSLQRNNTSGRVGVYKDAVSGKWVAQGVKNRKTFFLGQSDDFNVACKIREEWETSEGDYSNRNGKTSSLPTEMCGQRRF